MTLLWNNGFHLIIRVISVILVTEKKELVTLATRTVNGNHPIFCQQSLGHKRHPVAEINISINGTNDCQRSGFYNGNHRSKSHQP